MGKRERKKNKTNLLKSTCQKKNSNGIQLKGLFTL